MTTQNAVNNTIAGNALTSTTLQTPRTIGGVSFDGSTNITVQTATGGFTVSGGNLALGTNSITLTGSIGATGARVTKLWATDGEFSNMITVGGTSLSSTFQPLDSDLTTIAGLTATTDNFIVSVSSAWASRTPAQVRTTLGLVIGTNVQAWDADLDTIASLTATTDNFIQSKAGAWASRTVAQVKVDLGLTGTNSGDQTTSGTTNRISVTSGSTNPVIDISATYVGQSSITTLGTIATGTWQGTTINYAYLGSGGTGAGTKYLADDNTWKTVTGGTVTSVASADGSITVTNPTTTADLAVVKAPKWSTARNLAGNSVDGSANVAFANKFIVQGTTDTGLTGAQFLGALGTGIVKNTTTTGVLSIAVAGDFPTLNQSTTGSSASLTTPRTIGIVTGDATSAGSTFDGTANNTNALTFATVNANVGSFGSSTSIPTFTVNAKGLITAVSGNVVIAPAGTLTGTTLNATVVTSSLTSHGTITSGGLGTGAVIGGVTMTLGSDASFDTYYRNGSGVLTRLANGVTGQYLSANTGSAPTWASPSAGLTVGSSAITSGTNTRILYDNAGVLGEYTISGSGTVVAMATGATLTTTSVNGVTLVTGGSATKYLSEDGTYTTPSGGGGANTALSNLASVAINTTLVSDTNNTDDLGTSAVKWANLFVTTIGATGTRVTKGWFTDIESTNMPTVGGTAILTSLTAPQFTTIELGNASDTTLSRVSAGVIAVEGVTILTTTSISDTAYASSWDGVTTVAPSKNAVYDQIELVSNNNTIKGFQAMGSAIKGQTLVMNGLTDVTATNSLSTGFVQLMAIYLDRSVTLTGVKWYQATAGNYTGNNYNGIGLYSYSAGTLTLVASSTNDANIWKATSASIGTKAFTTPYAAVAGLYFIASLYSQSAQTTAPALGGGATVNTAKMTQDFTNSIKPFINITTGSQTAFPTPQASTGTQSFTLPLWFAVY